MATTIGAFVEELAKGGAWAKRFDDFPIRTMRAFGLNDRQIDKILNGSLTSLRNEVEKDLKRKVFVFRVKMG
jgi:hypothetical protein